MALPEPSTRQAVPMVGQQEAPPIHLVPGSAIAGALVRLPTRTELLQAGGVERLVNVAHKLLKAFGFFG